MDSQKSIVFVGQEGSGKEMVARSQVENLKPQEYVILKKKGGQMYFENLVRFNTWPPQIKVILIDGVTAVKELTDMYPWIDTGLVLGAPYRKPIKIQPRIIVVCSDSIKLSDLPGDELFRKRFDVVDCGAKMEIHEVV